MGSLGPVYSQMACPAARSCAQGDMRRRALGVSEEGAREVVLEGKGGRR